MLSLSQEQVQVTHILFSCILTQSKKQKIHKELFLGPIQESAHSTLVVDKDMELARKLMITIRACNLMQLKSSLQAHQDLI